MTDKRVVHNALRKYLRKNVLENAHQNDPKIVENYHNFTFCEYFSDFLFEIENSFVNWKSQKFQTIELDM